LDYAIWNFLTYGGAEKNSLSFIHKNPNATPAPHMNLDGFDNLDFVSQG